jgi:hypothetical protein
MVFLSCMAFLSSLFPLAWSRILRKLAYTQDLGGKKRDLMTKSRAKISSLWGIVCLVSATRGQDGAFCLGFPYAIVHFPMKEGEMTFLITFL